MASRFSFRRLFLGSRLLRPHRQISPVTIEPPIAAYFGFPSPSALRLLSTSASYGRGRRPGPPKKVDIGARARQLQTRRLWTYALTISGLGGFFLIVINNFQDAMVFYLTPTDAIEKFAQDPSKNKFRLGGLVLEGSIGDSSSSQDMEFVVTDLINDILVRFDGTLPDLFREGHSVVAEGLLKPITDEIRTGGSAKGASDKARSGDCYLSATEVLAKHDEKYMPAEVAKAIERNRKMIMDAAKKQS